MDIEIRNIQKRYGKKTVLRDASLGAAWGECVGILGGNGCGKSTLLGILAGTVRPDGGSFSAWDEDLLRSRSLLEQAVAYVPQGTPLIPELNALDNLKLWYDRDSLNRSLQSGTLAMLGIPEFLRTPVEKMSGGMKKRLSIGCAIAGDPRILLLDEPCAALDLICKEQILNYCRDFLRRGGTIFMATHDVQELALCGRTYILRDGIAVPYAYDGDVQRLVGSMQHG